MDVRVGKAEQKFSVWYETAEWSIFGSFSDSMVDVFLLNEIIFSSTVWAAIERISDLLHSYNGKNQYWREQMSIHCGIWFLRSRWIGAMYADSHFFTLDKLINVKVRHINWESIHLKCFGRS